jgi:hypothetical protein
MEFYFYFMAKIIFFFFLFKNIYLLFLFIILVKVRKFVEFKDS